MKIGFIFPGQGAQTIGMGKDLYNEYEEVKNIYMKASQILGIDLAKLTFESNEETLCETKNTQIAILLMSLAILEILNKHQIKAEMAAGLSLGEYSALVYSNMINFEDGIKIVRKRGELMQNLVPEGNWAMAAIIGLEDEKVEQACIEANKYGFVVPANYNCPKQVVISGEKEAVLEAMKIAKEKGAKLVRELKTSGPFHTEKLKKASEELKKELEKINIKNVGNIPVVKNIDAKIYTEKDNIKQILSDHIISPVRFKESIQTMINSGIDTFVEIGPRESINRIC